MSEANKFIDVRLTRKSIDLYWVRSSIFSFIQNQTKTMKGRLLDAGCGKMPYRSYILSHSEVTEYVGLDIETAIDYSDEVKPDIVWDGKTMPFDDQSFDCVMATEVLEHVPDTNNYLQEVCRVLKPSGVFFFTTPFLWPLHEIPHDEYRLTPFSVERLLREVNFVSINIQSLGGWNASLAQMLGLWLRRSPMNRYQRRLLSTILFPIYKYLVKSDKKGAFDSRMITGISGLAYKPGVSKTLKIANEY